jgi:hypothetical protein
MCIPFDFSAVYLPKLLIHEVTNRWKLGRADKLQKKADLACFEVLLRHKLTKTERLRVSNYDLQELQQE